METIETSHLVQKIADALASCDGEFIADIANQVLPGEPSVRYLEDELFEVDQTLDDDKEDF